MVDVSSVTHPADIYSPGSEPHWPDDRPRRIFQLVVTESTGPFEDERGYENGQECPGCDRRPEQGDEIVRFGTEWWHLACSTKHMRAGGADAAWLALGADLAARPSKYGVTETRAIVRNLLRLTVTVEG